MQNIIFLLPVPIACCYYQMTFIQLSISFEIITLDNKKIIMKRIYLPTQLS
jgi:hypothetical protein